MADYPLSDRLSEMQTEYVAIHEFLEHLSTEGIWLAHYKDVGYQDLMLVPIGEQHETVVLRFLDIDATALEQERRAMLEALRG